MVDFSASAFCGCWFDLLWWRSRYALLMRPNNVETAVPYVGVCRIFKSFNIYMNLLAHSVCGV